jgi:hypothetical protein
MIEEEKNLLRLYNQWEDFSELYYKFPKLKEALDDLYIFTKESKNSVIKKCEDLFELFEKQKKINI